MNAPQRWGKAEQYPDMWADPAEDPREGHDTPDGELPTLRDYLAGYRLTLLMKCEGLDAAQLATRSVPPSRMSLLGLLRHLAEVERDWRTWLGEELPSRYGHPDGDFDGARPDPACVAEAREALAAEQEATDAALEAVEDPAEKLGPRRIALRDLMVHRVEEYARHCGHADLLRECVDGRVGQ